ncbi:MAG TPA: glycosyltransferase family 39 protein [Polyangia bacterium]|nr:glycosyltransferase family 39 protein [Polyangia bacterium]
MVADQPTDLSGSSAVSRYLQAAAQSRARRWHALDRGEQVALVGITILLAGAVAVRAWFMVAYRPAFLGFQDSHGYVLAAARNIFRDAQHPAGYPFFLRLVHHLSDRLSFTILVQHALGVATGLLLYKSVRRAGGPPWLGLFPAAVAFFGGTGLFLEHSLLADPLLTFLQAVGIYAAVRALREPALRWPLLAGLAIGISFWVKTVALSSAVLVPLLLLLAAPGVFRRRLLSATAAALAAVVLIGVYVGAQAYFTGYVGYERQSAWNLYGRVATFVDCSRFTPPEGTRFLCPIEPLAHRLPQAFYQYGPTSPAVRRFGGPSRAPQYANALLQKFSVAAIEHEPIAYIGAVLHGLTFYIDPRPGEGYTPASIRYALLEAAGDRSIAPAIALYYPHSVGYHRSAGATRSLSAYESHTRIQGPLLILLLLTAIGGIPLLPRRMRSVAILFTFTAIFSILFAEAGSSYDARYAYPTFGPLAAGAALGGWGIASCLRQATRRQGQT